MKLKQSLLVLSLVVMGLLFVACGGGGATDTMVTLTVEKAGTGTGTVISEPAGINLAAGAKMGSKAFNKDAMVKLTAQAAAGSTFGGFRNCTAGTGAAANTCVVDLGAAKTVTVTFTQTDPSPNPDPGPNPNPDPGPNPNPDPGPNPDPDPGPNPNPDPGTPATFTQTVTVSENDAEEFTTTGAQAATAGRVFTNSGDLEMNYDVNLGAQQLVGLRFTDLDIPQNATIVDAFIQFEAKESSSTPSPVLSIAGEAGLAPAIFVAGTAANPANKDISNRTLTTTTVPWTPEAWAAGQAGANEQTPNLASIVQENVTAGQVTALVFVISGDGTKNSRNAWSSDGTGTAPVLTINYTVP